MATDLKQKIYLQLMAELNERIDSTQKAIQSLEQEKNNETKSIAGDKFETGRVMMQAESDRLSNQLKNAVQLKIKLTNLDFKTKRDIVNSGSLVYVNSNVYFISIGVGSIKVNDQKIFVISLASPIGQLLAGKKVGDNFIFRNQKLSISQIE